MIQNEKNRRRVKIFVWLCTLIGVVTMSLLPESSPVIENIPPVWADLAHVPAYALLTFLTVFVTETRVRVSPAILVVIVMMLSLFGGVIEILQPITGRTADIMDALRNMVGSGFAAWVYWIWMARPLDTAKKAAKKPVP